MHLDKQMRSRDNSTFLSKALKAVKLLFHHVGYCIVWWHPQDGWRNGVLSNVALVPLAASILGCWTQLRQLLCVRELQAEISSSSANEKLQVVAGLGLLGKSTLLEGLLKVGGAVVPLFKSWLPAGSGIWEFEERFMVVGTGDKFPHPFPQTCSLLEVGKWSYWIGFCRHIVNERKCEMAESNDGL